MSHLPPAITELSGRQKRDLLTRLLATKARANTTAPLSYAQQRLWFLDQLAPGSAFYNMPIALRLRMLVDVSALTRTLNEIIRRHDVLRTSFATRDGCPVQVIAPELQLAVREIDLRHLPFTQRETEAQHQATIESRKPFDLTCGPLIRAGLLRLGDEDYLLLLTLHHIIADGWSLGVLFSEISSLYAAFAEKRRSPLPELPIQFADYATWQRRWLQGPVLQAQLAYWVQQLADLPELALPTDRLRPAVATFRGARRFFTIAEDLREPIEALGRRSGATLFMTLLAVVQVLFYRYTGQEDFPVGAPIANRTRKETEGLIGFFVNTLVFRANLSGQPTFRELLARVRETALAAYAHQDLPFERLVEELHPVRDAARIPLIQTMFALQNTPGTTGPAGRSLIEMMEVERGTANFDLVLDLWEHDQDHGLGGRIEYCTDLFDPDTIERLLEHFRTLLAAAAASPDERISALPLLTADDHQRIVVDWNATSRDYPADAPLSRLFETQAAATPEAIAIQFDDRSLTYAETNARANQIAHCLQDSGVMAGDLVVVHLERSIELVLALLGILKAGAAYVPLDVTYPEARLTAMIGDARPRAIVANRAHAVRLPLGEAVLVALDENADIWRASRNDPPTTRTGSDPAYVMYTSGSTGAPKGIVIPQRGVTRLVRESNYIEITPADRIAQASNVSFDASTFEIWGALLNGAQLVGVSKEVALSPEDLSAFLRDQRITTLFLTTALFNQVASMRPDAFRGLKHLLFGGEAVDAAWVREVLAGGAPQRLLHVYGPTESTTFATWHLVKGISRDATSIPIGQPLSNTTAYVLDSHGRPVPIGVVGELHLGGPGLALEYLGDPERTAESFVHSPFGRLYRTGDLVRLGPELTLTFVGRRDGQVKLRGHRVELGEVEAHLLRHPGVREAKVVVRESEAGNKCLAAYVVPEPDGTSYVTAGDGPCGDDRVSEWQHVYDEVIYGGLHEHAIARQEPTFNIAGWKSSYTGQPLSPEEMREQVDQTVERILALAPVDVLEIGCGTGLLLFRIAPFTRRYVATDFSRPALDYVERQLESRTSWPVTLLERRADDFSAFGDQRFDVVILNSVIQYFPDRDYLLTVLKGAVSMLKPGGAIFVGDVRSFELLEAFHVAVELHQAPRTLSASEVRARARRRVAAERELVVSPQFFLALGRELPQITDVIVEPKRGRRHNELTRFRYDVTLRTESDELAQSFVATRDWCRHDFSVDKVRQELLASEPAMLCIERIPNARTFHAIEAARRLEANGAFTAGELRQALDATSTGGIDPEALWAMSDDVPYIVEISWSRGWADGAFDVVFRRVGSKRAGTRSVMGDGDDRKRADTNNPQWAEGRHGLLPQLREFMQRRLPEYMVPAVFVALEKMPLTPNGKVDVRALPPPDIDRPAISGRYVPPRTALERVLAKHWASVLGLERVGVTDSFFELGGHSLLATQLVARVSSTLAVPVTLRTLFSKPTVADLSAALLAEAGPHHQLERVADLVLAVLDMPEEEAASMLAFRTAEGSMGAEI